MTAKPLIYRTLEGMEVPYGPVSTKLTALVDIKYPTDVPPPTYRIETITDDFEEHPHDAESIKSESTTDQERAAWAAYEAEKERLTKKHNEELIRVCFLQGIKLALPDDDSWLDPHRYLGADIPEDPHDLRLYWLFTEVVKTDHDIYNLARAILGAANAYLGMRAVAASTFRGALGRTGGADASGTDDEDSAGEQGMVA